MLWIVALMAGYGPYDAAASDRSRALQARESEIVCTITFDMQDEFVVFAPGSAELSAAESTCLALWIDHWGARNQDGRYRGISIVARGVWIAADRVDLTLTKRRAAAVGGQYGPGLGPDSAGAPSGRPATGRRNEEVQPEVKRLGKTL